MLFGLSSIEPRICNSTTQEDWLQAILPIWVQTLIASFLYLFIYLIIYLVLIFERSDRFWDFRLLNTFNCRVSSKFTIQSPSPPPQGISFISIWNYMNKFCCSFARKFRLYVLSRKLALISAMFASCIASLSSEWSLM